MGERSSPLLESHRALGAKLIDFAGWEMPLHYEGTVAEHRAVRTSVGVFDVSHLGKLRVSGERAEQALQVALTADVGSLEVGRAVYSLALSERGGCIDDVFVYRLGRREWLLVPNAANVAAVADAVGSAGATPADEWDRWAILAVQGPRSFEVFDTVFPSAGAPRLDLHGCAEIDVFGESGLVARTGYTGERGFELYAPGAVAERAFAALLEHATPVGLGARDTLRLEMGYALYGHELTPDVNPLEAGLGWTLAWETPFRGRDALLQARRSGPSRELVGIRCTGRGIPRQGHGVHAGGKRVGQVTSGNFSPTLGTGIALALGVRADLPDAGGEVTIEARGRSIEGIIVKPPFIERSRTS